MQHNNHQSGSRARQHPPVPPRIPQNNIQSLVPRLTTTINDIDSFKNLLAQGAEDGTMPNWDITLQRYSVLLGRITALSQYISQAPPSLGPIPVSDPSSSSQRPVLSSYLAHPLRPLPTQSEGGAEISPFAPDVYFQVLNTLPIPQLSLAQDELLSNSLLGSGMTERDLVSLETRLRDRFKRERGRAKGLKDEIEERKDEVDWGMRVDVEDEEGEDGSLFGDDEEEEEGGKAVPAAIPVPAPNPREGWTIQDYVRYMEKGIAPLMLPPGPAPASNTTTITIE